MIDNQWIFYGIMFFNNTQSKSLIINNSIVLVKSTTAPKQITPGFWNRKLNLFNNVKDQNLFSINLS